MRAVRLPSNLAVGSQAHSIVATVEGSDSYQRFSTELQLARSTGSKTSNRFRIDNLTAIDLSQLMRMSRMVSHPEGSFNFSSPGDMGGSGKNSAVLSTTPDNNAFMHVVGRTAGDYEPNNMIYHLLQRYQSGSDEHAGFDAFLKSVQKQPPQSLEELIKATAAQKNLTCCTVAEKQKLDPLFNAPDAYTKSMENQKVCMSVSASSKTSGIFYFYPYPCQVAVSIPYCSHHFCVMVNLKPIVPGHLMVIPVRCVGTIHGLTEEEVNEWGETVALTIRVLNALKAAKTPELAHTTSYSVSIQQGEAAGQTVPHLHTHIIPFDPSGLLAGEPESGAEEQMRRTPRTPEMMQEETEELRGLFDSLANSAHKDANL